MDVHRGQHPPRHHMVCGKVYTKPRVQDINARDSTGSNRPTHRIPKHDRLEKLYGRVSELTLPPTPMLPSSPGQHKNDSGQLDENVPIQNPTHNSLPVDLLQLHVAQKHPRPPTHEREGSHPGTNRVTCSM